jgi:hypothetical protein
MKKKKRIVTENDWIPVGIYSSVRIAEFDGVLQIQKGNRYGQTNQLEWMIAKTWDEKVKGPVPVRKPNGAYLCIPTNIPLAEDKSLAINILQALISQIEKESIINDKS